MANSNFIVHNGLTVGPLTIDAVTGNIYTSGNIVTTGTGSISSANGFGGLNPSQIYSGSSNVTVTANNIWGNIAGTNVLNVSSTGLTIVGSLTVTGATTTIQSTTLDVTDLNITVAKGSGSAAAANGAGITVDGAAATILYTSLTDSWNFNKQTIGQFTTSNLVVTGGTVTGITGAASTFTSTNFSTGNAQITGGSIAGAHSGTAAFSTATATNFSSGNAQITGGAISGAISGTAAFSTATATNLSSGNLQVSGAITPNANATVNIGSVSAWFATIYGVSTQAKYADLAENYQADSQYEPGTVVEFGGTNEVTVAVANSRKVAGVVSTNPAHLMNGGLTGTNVVPLALTGRVPCKVVGPVAKGDLMVSAGFGYAKTDNDPAVGQVIGKALADFSGTKGVIEVVVGRF